MMEQYSKGAKRMADGTMAGRKRLAALPLVLALSLGLSGCLSLSPDVPDSLLELIPQKTVQAGVARSGNLDQAIAVVDPEAPAKLDVLRVPVQGSASDITYLKDAVWVEKPARQFGRLLAETIRANGTRLVLDSTDGRYQAATRLGGQLLDMGYDAPSQSVVVRYDAIVTRPDGSISNQRFESKVPGVLPVSAAIGPALNQAANDVAQQVANWIG
jgi:cholesterol transport system auxiliary component